MSLQISRFSVRQPYDKILTWLLWVAATMVGTCIGLLLCIIVALMTWGTGLLGAGIIIGVLVGGAQGLVLQKLGLRYTTGSLIRRWIVANSIGGGISLIAVFVLWSTMIAFYVFVVRDTQDDIISFWYSLFTIVSVSVGFGLFGVAQWIILRGWLRNAVWWIPLNVLGGAVAISIAIVLLGSSVVESASSDPAVALDFVALVFSASVLVTAIWSLISGAGLVLLTSIGSNERESR